MRHEFLLNLYYPHNDESKLLRRIIERIKEHNLKPVVTFITFKKAFDTNPK